MTGLELRVWEANIPHVHAEEALRERGGSMSPEELRRCVLLATGDELQADKAFAKRWHQTRQAQG